MDIRGSKTKPKEGSAQRKKAGNDADEYRKLTSLVWPAFAAFANATEKYVAAPRRARIARRTLPAHLDRAVIAAESFEERDLVYRRFASQCYRISKRFVKTNDSKEAARWMNLALRFMRLSMSPKKQAADERFERQLTELAQKIKELEEQEQKEEAI
jgi:hypothetical protein